MERLLHFKELDSTNLYLKTHHAKLPEKTIVTADQQTAGRGRDNREWVSRPGGLYFSVLLKPSKIDFSPNFTQLMALCVCYAAETWGLSPVLKWPNDVLINNQKLCGILSEAVAAHNQVQALVLGVGLNVAQEDLSHVGQPAVSLKNLRVELTPQEVLQTILDFFWRDYPALEKHGFETIRNAYKKRFAFLGKEIAVKNGQETLFGAAEELSPRGTLLLNTAQGLKEIYIGDLIV